MSKKQLPCMLLVILSLSTVLAPLRASGRPNIVFLFADDLGYGELGCQGNPQIPTPHIDGLAERGVRFTQGYVAASYCSASRAGLMTARYPARFGYDYNPTGALNADPRAGLPRREVSIAQQLLNGGYATALIGKWHLGGTADYHPLRRGFGEFFGFLHEGHYFVPPPYDEVTTMLRRRKLPPVANDQSSHQRWVSSDGRMILSSHMGHNEPAYDANNPILRDGQPIAEPAYLTGAITREALDFIDRHRDQPFFLYVAYNAVHSPLQAPNALVDRFHDSIPDMHRRIFAAMLTSLDHSVGAILQRIADAGLSQRTLIFFISDNGGPTRELTSSNLPLRGGKGDLYEGGIRVPFIVCWDGHLPMGKVDDRPVITLDAAVTAASAAGEPFSRPVDGVDLVPFLQERMTERPHDRLFWRMNRKGALRDGDWKLVRHGLVGQGSWELFDLSNDLRERADLAAAQPDVLNRLIGVWENLDSEMQRPVVLR